MNSFKLISLSIAILVTGCARSCAEPAPTLRIGTNVWPGYEPLHYGANIGTISADNVTVVEFGSATESIRAFRSHLVDAAALTLDEILLLAHDGIPTRLQFVMDISNGADVIIAHPSIRSLKDLKGRKIGLEDTTLGGYMLSRALSLSGMSVKDVQPVYVELDQHQKAFAEGRVDAIVTSEPVRSQLLAAGDPTIFSSRDIPGEIVDLMVSRADIQGEQGDRLREFQDSWFKTLESIESDRSKAIAFMASREGMSVDQFSDALANLKVPSRLENEKMLYGDDRTILRSIREIKSFLRSTGRFSREFDETSILPEGER